MDRRTFLKISAITAGALAVGGGGYLWTRGVPRLRRSSPRRVIVIGAGLAGLSAAYELVRAGHDVVVLEAQKRPGGRVRTIRGPFDDGLIAEAGASRIPDNHHVTLGYARDFGLELIPFYPSTGRFVRTMRGHRAEVEPGREVDPAQFALDLNAEEREVGVGAMWGRHVNPILRTMGDPTALAWPPPSMLEYDRVSDTRFLRELGFSRDAVALESLGYSDPDDEDWAVSALELLRTVAMERTETTRYKIAGGNDLLPKAFAERLADRIRYGASVVRIEQGEDRADVVYRVDGRQESESADRVICTLPFPVLRGIDVSPPFSAPKRRAIDELGYDAVSRMFVQVSERYWERWGDNGFALTDDPLELWHPTWDQPGQRGVLMTYMRSRLALRVAEMATSERLSTTLEQIGRVHPGVHDYVEKTHFWSWDKDPWQRGAYAIYKPGQFETLHAHVASAEGRVHFAGEHTSPWSSWMQGAFDSAHRVVREVNDAAS